MGSNALKAYVETPGVAGEEPEIEELPLPPQEMWAQLDNSGAAPAAEPAVVDAGPTAAPPVAKPEAAQLQFLNNATVVQLSYPFKLDEAEIREIKIRRLTLGEVDDIISRPSGVSITGWDLYARMTGLPIEVLRGMDDDDGRAVMKAADDFLPRSLRTDGA